MNILMFTRCMGEGGTEKIIIQLCEVLQKTGHSVFVCSDGGKSEEVIKSMGIKFFRIPDMQIKNPIAALKIISVINKIIRNEKIDIVHVHHRMAAFYCQIMGLRKKCKLMATSHNTFHDKKLFTQIAYRNFKIVACGEKVKANLEKEYNIANITVIHNAVKAFDGHISIDPKLKADKETGHFMVANIGRINEQKGMEYFIRSYDRIRQKHHEVKFYIVGTGIKENEIRNLAERENADVSFLGYREDVYSIIAQMDLIVLSSLWEGFPLTPIETFAMGKTIVATDVDGTSEIIQNGKNGCLVQPGSADQIADMICWMIENPEKKSIMEKEALKTFQDKFSIEVFAKSYLDFYRSLLNER